jgi:hypothetical protein
MTNSRGATHPNPDMERGTHDEGFPSFVEVFQDIRVL